jgi:hypothetical protein
MVTAILPSLTDDTNSRSTGSAPSRKPSRAGRNSIAQSIESELTITPERYRGISEERVPGAEEDEAKNPRKPSALAGYVGLFTGCGALVALSLFLPLPAKFGETDGVTPAQAVSRSFYVVGTVAFVVAVFVSFGLRNLKGEEGKGWRVLLRLRSVTPNDRPSSAGTGASSRQVSPGPSFEKTLKVYFSADIT